MLALPNADLGGTSPRSQQGERNPVKSGETLQLKGCVIDSRLLGLSADGLIAPIRKRPRTRSSRSSPRRPPSPSPNRSLSQNQSQSRFLSTGGADWSSASTTCCCGTESSSATWYPYRYAAGCSVTCAGRCRPANGAGNAAGAIAPGHRADTARRAEHPPALLPDVDQHQQVVVDGVVYVSVFNPLDGRKNWHHLITAFCWAFRDTSDATLVLKMTRAT